ncbi:Zinc finger-containing ubiquitin peptidase 1 [Fulvia fulva]|uniref:Zinc finger-containing ubiquitin peptidase 1 n=1 Tax=Passalora fulva TaxID=5499 RepID=A0A9Q8UR54_PASFU|nr:Zinc finger-containing ubiquitin peptidase 1 [Fulvia fulva]UJO19362.1 Zinc finger-containing ubiquitin peptidase 1 [Fulvia fulva]
MANACCPFCGYNGNEHAVQLHIEEHHTDDSPFVPNDQHPSKENRVSANSSSSAAVSSSSHDSMPSDEWTRCTRPGCGEHIHLTDIDEHLDLHVAAALQEQENERPPPLPPRRSPRPDRPQPASSGKPSSPPRKLDTLKSRLENSPSRGSGSILSFFSGTSNYGRSSTVRHIRPPTNPGRLGKRELGPYAFEQRMPDKVRHILLHDAEPEYVQRIGSDGRLVRQAFVPNQTQGVINVLADLCSLDKDNAATFLCHPCVRHIHKLECDGNFCGFWNIQVLLTYVQHMDRHGPQTLPTVVKIQELIEKAWDSGVGAYGRTETGGILNTRKWIGTQEALTFFTRIGVNSQALAFKDGNSNTDPMAAEELLDHVEAYFISGEETARRHGTSRTTNLPPIYFQRAGHSMTIVGIERKHDGSRNLLVFDSSFATSKPMMRLIDGRKAQASIDNLLKVYRRSDVSLTRWSEFEILVPLSMQRAQSA